MRAKIENVPTLLPKNAHRCAAPDQRIAFAGDRLYQGGFSAAVWAEYCDMFAALDFESESIQSQQLPSLDENVLQIE